MTQAERFQHGINRIALSKDGLRQATSDVDMNVVVIEGGITIFSGNFSSINEKIKPTERIRGLAFSPDGTHLYVAAGDAVWSIRLQDGKIDWSYVAPRSFGFLIISPISLDVSDQGDIAAAFDNGSVVVWSSFGAIKSMWQDNDSPRVLKFAPGGHEIIGTDSFSLCVWNVAARRCSLKIGMPGRVYGMDVHPSGTTVAVRTLQQVHVLDLSSKQVIYSIPVEPGSPIVALHPIQPWVACGEGHIISISDFLGNSVLKHELHATSGLCLSFHPSGDQLLVGCTEREVAVIELRA